MYADRRSGDFIKDVHSFLNVAEANKAEWFYVFSMRCLSK
jgi:hypothetical protein